MVLTSGDKNRGNAELAVAIVEDDKMQAAELYAMVHEYSLSTSTLFQFDVQVFNTLPEFQSILETGFHFDVVIMDVDFGATSPTGIEAVAQWFPSGCGTQVIYVSGHSEFCTSVYRTEHVYFLLKPCKRDDMHDALDKALEHVRSYRQKTLAVKVYGSVMALPVESITHIESNKRKILIHTVTSDVSTYASLAEMMSVLPDSFVQCHKSFLVNMSHINQLRNNEIVLNSGAIIPISQKRRKVVLESFMHYARGCVSARGK